MPPGVVLGFLRPGVSLSLTHGVVEELEDGEPFVGVDCQQVANKILGRRGDIIPPWRKESELALCNLLRENLYALIVEGREAAQQCVQHTTKGPHVDGLGIPFILDDLGCRVANGATWCHGLVIPDDLGKTEICNLNLADAACTDTLDELTLVDLVLISGLLWLGVLGRDDRYLRKQDVLWLDVSVGRRQ